MEFIRSALKPQNSTDPAYYFCFVQDDMLAAKGCAETRFPPWPFPDSLMIGFTAEYQSGEIKADGNEITEAVWFRADALPKVPTRRSLSSELIQWFCDKKS